MAEATPRYEPPAFDPQTPNFARIYDYLLGGKDHFAADREAAEQALSIEPGMRDGALAARGFLTRAVRYLVGAGIRQFLDIGCGLPTQGNVHEVARSVSPDVRVVYVDYDPAVVTHARALLETDSQTLVLRGDLRDPEELLADPALPRLMDLSQPAAVLMLNVLHFVPEDEVAQHAVRTLRDAVAPGSHIAIAHVVSDLRPRASARINGMFQDRLRIEARRPNVRTRAEVEAFFEGLELVEPGVVVAPEWRPDSGVPVPATPFWAVAGVGRKP